MPGTTSESPAKKRKRDGESDVRASKKVATASTVRISVLRDNGELCPVVASSPGITIPQSNPLKVYTKRTGNQPYELLLQSSAHPRLDYEARQEHHGPQDYLQHYVGIYDPTTGDMKLVEARHLTMRTSLRPEESSDDEQQEEVRRTNAAKKFDLTTAFGTKKAKKAVSSLSTNAIAPSKEGDAAEAALLESVVASDAPTREVLQSAVDEAKPRPLANLQAASVRDVYPLSSIIGADEMRLVPIQEWLDKRGDPIQTHSLYVSKRVAQVCASADPDDVATHERIIALRYLYILTELYAAGKTMFGGGKRLPKREVLLKTLGIDGRLLNSVMRRFGSSGNLTKWDIDYLITHVCALALIADEFRVLTSLLRDDLALKDRDMLQYFREIGCVIIAATEADVARANVKKDSSVKYRTAKLKLPLEFPKQRLIVQKKR